MGIFVHVIRLLIILFITNVIFAGIERLAAKTKNDNCLRLPKAYLIIGITCYVIFHLPILSYVLSSDYSRLEMIVFFTIAIFVSFILSISQINWKIQYSNAGFLYRTIFRHSLQFSYYDVKKVIWKGGEVFIKGKNRWLIIDKYVDAGDFFKHLNKYYGKS